MTGSNDERVQMMMMMLAMRTLTKAKGKKICMRSIVYSALCSSSGKKNQNMPIRWVQPSSFGLTMI